MGGTEPLARLLGATSIDTTSGPQALAGNVIARFTAAAIVPLLDPSSSVAATVEMQTHVASFLASKGTALVVANPGVLAPAQLITSINVKARFAGLFFFC